MTRPINYATLSAAKAFALRNKLVELDAQRGTYSAMAFSMEYEDQATEENYSIYLEMLDAYYADLPEILEVLTIESGMAEIRDAIMVHLRG